MKGPRQGALSLADGNKRFCQPWHSGMPKLCFGGARRAGLREDGLALLFQGLEMQPMQQAVSDRSNQNACGDEKDHP